VTRQHRLCLIGLLSVALVVRVIAYVLFHGIVSPDEVFQYVEPAHRIVFGTGLIPWEYQLGVRSWLFPGFMVGVLEVARIFGDGPVAQNAVVAMVMASLSLLPVACGYFWGLRAAGLSGGLLAGGLNAVWSDAVLFSIHPLLDGVGAVCLVCSVYLADRADRTSSKRDFMLAGMVLGLTVALRVQLLPAAGVTALLYCRWALRQRWWPILGGMAGILLAQGVLDAVTLGLPFQSFWYYFWVNQVSGVASFFGASSWYDYLVALRWNWSLALPALAVCAAVGAWRQPRLLAISAAIILVFSCIPHKEERFIYPAIPLMLTVAGIGSAMLGHFIMARLRSPLPDWLLGVAGTMIWAALSLLASFHGALRWEWLEGRGMVAAMNIVSADPNACGLAIIPPERWVFSGGYTHLRPGIRLVQFTPDDHIDSVTGFDYAIAEDTIDLDRYGMTKEACWQNSRPGRTLDLPTACLWHNPPGCAGVVLPELKPTAPPAFFSSQMLHPFGLSLRSGLGQQK
jgi:phosphatidylinositol glycan class B